MTFKAWRIGSEPVAFEIATSPAGPVHVRSYGAGQSTVPEPGTAIVLPTKRTIIVWPHVELMVGPGCYAQVPGGASLRMGAGLLIYTREYTGQYQAGGPVEDAGRLHYIDGCSDSLLICPAQRGDPCLNLLHLPPGIAQTEHTHPSDRIGLVLRGEGICRTADGDTALMPGAGWIIPADYAHSFHTIDDPLDVIVWHPDSDFGPSHDEHPMLNRTIVDQLPATAAQHAGIRTK
jgi:quercetin dioxygenase-like cupin family protein